LATVGARPEVRELNKIAAVQGKVGNPPLRFYSSKRRGLRLQQWCSSGHFHQFGCNSYLQAQVHSHNLIDAHLHIGFYRLLETLPFDRDGVRANTQQIGSICAGAVGCDLNRLIGRQIPYHNLCSLHIRTAGIADCAHDIAAINLRDQGGRAADYDESKGQPQSTTDSGVCLHSAPSCRPESRVWWRTPGTKTLEFERAFAAFHGARHGIAVTNGTAALEVVMAALNVGPGDEVIVPDFTFIATTSAVLFAGALPVMVDVLPDTYCIDSDLVEAGITQRTKAIIAVHMGGHPADLDRLSKIARDRGIALV